MNSRCFLLISGVVFLSQNLNAACCGPYGCRPDRGQDYDERMAPRGYQDQDYQGPNYQGQGYQGPGYQSPAFQRRGYREESYQGAYQGQNDMQDQDRDLTDRIQKTFGPNFSYRNVRVHANNGVVTVTGTVENEGERQDIKNKIQKIEGVRMINDQIQIQRAPEQAPERNRAISDNYNYYRGNRYVPQYEEQRDGRGQDDQRIGEKIRDILKGGLLSRGYDQVQFQVSDGRVSLRGAVPSEGNRKDIMERVSKIDGVRAIENEITVQPAAKASNGY